MGRHPADRPEGAGLYQIVCLSCGYRRAWTTLVDALADGRGHIVHLAPSARPAQPLPTQPTREETGGAGSDPSP
jgi:hypothetical protein